MFISKAISQEDSQKIGPVDHFLQPLVPHMISHVKDTTDFLIKIQRVGQIVPGSILVSFDVTFLYTNIPNIEGIKAVFMYLQKHRPSPHVPSNTTLCKLLYLVLKSNNFEFNGEQFLQVGGTEWEHG